MNEFETIRAEPVDWNRLFRLLDPTRGAAGEPADRPLPEVQPLDVCVASIAKDIRSRKLVLFAGAGISHDAPAGAPLWDELKLLIVDALRTNLPPALGERVWSAVSAIPPGFESRPELLFEILTTYAPHVALEPLDVLSLGTPNRNHQIIGKIAASGLLPIIITPNLDTYLEDALEAADVTNLGALAPGRIEGEFRRRLEADRAGQYYAVVQPAENSGRFYLPREVSLLATVRRHPNLTVIFKVHGTIKDPSSIQVALRQTGRPLRGPTLQCFEEWLQECSVLILGYSGRDDDLYSALVKLAAEGRLASHGRLYWNVREVLGEREAFLISECETGGGSSTVCRSDAAHLLETVARVLFSPSEVPKRVSPEPSDAMTVEHAARERIDAWGQHLTAFESEICLGTLLLHLSQFEIARKVFEEALDELSGSHRWADAVPVFHGLATALQQTARRHKASEMWNRCLVFAKDCREFPENDESLLDLPTSTVRFLEQSAALRAADLEVMKRSGYEPGIRGLAGFLSLPDLRWPVREVFEDVLKEAPADQRRTFDKLNRFGLSEPDEFRRRVDALIGVVTHACSNDDVSDDWRLLGIFCEVYGYVTLTGWRGLSALPYYDHARHAYEQGGDQAGISEVLYEYGVRVYRHDRDSAMAAWARSLRVKRELGDQQGVAEIMLDMTQTIFSDETGSILRQSLHLFRSAGDPRGQIRALIEIASLGQTTDAERLVALEEALQLCDAIGEDLGGSWLEHEYNVRSSILSGLGHAHESMEQPLEAVRRYREFLDSRKAATGIRNGFDMVRLVHEAAGHIRRIESHYESLDRAVRLPFDATSLKMYMLRMSGHVAPQRFV